MPLLDIANVHLSLQSSLAPVWPQSVFQNQVLLGSWKISELHRRLKFSFENLEKQGSRLNIRAVATLEPKPSVWRENGSDDSDSESSLPDHVELKEEARVDFDEREKMRRMKISKAHKGRTPWNKGKKHSEETRNRIRERTKIAMQDPKVRMKLVNLGLAQSKETRLKIALGWARRREKLKLQETCHFEWQNLLAEASRKGLLGEDELQWDSYEVLNEQSKREWAESSKLRKNMPHSPEQRKKIAAGVAAKWADPAYRELRKARKTSRCMV